MKNICVLFIFLLSTSAYSTEIQHGDWSSASTIVQINSYWSFTSFKITDPNRCGGHGDGWWKLLHGSTNQEASTYKKSILLAAYMSGKTVTLRCENGGISDFTVNN
ncbi:MAG: hypothetical protein GY820_03685 [Gammaproteobacteria bacterium]|nr:hypothetical protein [Gammaproteobacteria bacterium]